MLCWQPSITPSRSASQPPGIQQNSSAARAAGHRRRSMSSSPLSCQSRYSFIRQPICPSAAARSPAPARSRSGRRHAEAHQPVLVGAWRELDLAHRPRELAEEERRGLLVVPHMRAGPVTTAVVIGAALPAEEPAVRRAEDRLRAQRAEVEQRGLLHLRGRSLDTKSLTKATAAALQRVQLRCEPAHGGPGVVVQRGVVVADDVGFRPGAPVRKVPGENEGEA